MPYHLQKPQMPYNGIPQENVFFCLNEINEVVSFGYMMVLFKPEMYPDRQLNMYISISGPPGQNRSAQIAGRELLLGALIARGNQVRESYPNLRSRLFACVDIRDRESIAFYQSAGFDVQSSLLNYCSIQIPNVQSAIPMGFRNGITPLQREADYVALLQRLQCTQRVLMSGDEFASYTRSGIFIPFYTARINQNGAEVVGEAVFTGNGNGSALLVALYVQKELRYKGLEEALLNYAMNLLKNNYGVNQFFAFAQTNIPCEKELINTSAAILQTQLCYPERLYG